MPALLARGALHAGLWLIGFVALALLLQRPLFAAALVLAMHALLLAVSVAKQRVLREPLVLADLSLFTQAIRHPRLYLPYFGLWRAAAVAVAFIGIVLAGFALEPARSLAPAVWALLALVAFALLALGSRARASLEPHEDVARFGVAGSMWLYWLAERVPLSAPAAPFGALQLTGERNPPIVVVQSESFFDVRRLDASIPREVLAHYDALCAQGEHGRLGVPVWGAYTMRTEFAFLSGIASSQLGVHRFNPYRSFARRGVATLASALRARGYRTVCVHPYPASFFERDRVFPLHGFDLFLDAAEFRGARRVGPYVADAEVGARIAGLLREAGAPLFVFAITMENHGPLHLEPGDELATYLAHLRNADAMFGALAQELERLGDGALCVYGDHVPGMPDTYARLRYDDPRTDYLIWSAGRPKPSRADPPVDLQVERLALRLLERAGLAVAPG